MCFSSLCLELVSETWSWMLCHTFSFWDKSCMFSKTNERKSKEHNSDHFSTEHLHLMSCICVVYWWELTNVINPEGFIVRRRCVVLTERWRQLPACDLSLSFKINSLHPQSHNTQSYWVISLLSTTTRRQTRKHIPIKMKRIVIVPLSPSTQPITNEGYRQRHTFCKLLSLSRGSWRQPAVLCQTNRGVCLCVCACVCVCVCVCVVWETIPLQMF